MELSPSELVFTGLGVGAIIFIVIFLVVGLVMFTVAVGRMAKRLGRNVSFYVILSLFVTPFGCAFILYCSGETEEHRKIRYYEDERRYLTRHASQNTNSMPGNSSREERERDERFMPR